MVEPVSGPKPYPLRTARDVIAVLDRVHAPNIGFLCDLFHLANNGDDIDAALAAYARRIAHVQIADHPGRGEPGTGTSTSAATSAPSKPPATPGTSDWSTFRPRPRSTASAGCARRKSSDHEQDRIHWPRHHGGADVEHLVKAGHTVIGFNRLLVRWSAWWRPAARAPPALPKLSGKRM